MIGMQRRQSLTSDYFLGRDMSVESKGISSTLIRYVEDMSRIANTILDNI